MNIYFIRIYFKHELIIPKKIFEHWKKFTVTEVWTLFLIYVLPTLLLGDLVFHITMYLLWYSVYFKLFSCVG